MIVDSHGALCNLCGNTTSSGLLSGLKRYATFCQLVNFFTRCSSDLCFVFCTATEHTQNA
ncbi:MAG: hypothetical protein H3C25_01145 [Candidatus Brocadia sapporoensis]|nr:hypothetical protein [Candidatus Brocadia sapporoensis]QQR67626.1 MAG: hypothetical protein IPI25_05330 [Candidatus Brocadia sp.]